MKAYNSIICILMLFTLFSCAITKSSIVSLNNIEMSEKEISDVEFYAIKPTKKAIALGRISVNGNGYSSLDDIVQEAKKQAAKLGADFILEEKSGIETKTIFNPGYSSYQSNGNGVVNGSQNYIHGSANENASAFSIGPSISTVDLPWAYFTAWVYTPCNLGIGIDDDYIVSDFHLNSDGENNGVMIGDKLIGMDGFDVRDDACIQHVMKIMPGDIVNITLLRDGKRLVCNITTLPNW
jgi:membrane-associated protease RseP (regulator of RpoE activity)